MEKYSDPGSGMEESRIRDKHPDADPKHGRNEEHILYYTYSHGLINYGDTKAKYLHLKSLPVKGLCIRCLYHSL
jgi:hypothetical protein